MFYSRTSLNGHHCNTATSQLRPPYNSPTFL